MKKYGLIIIAALLLVPAGQAASQAGEVDILVDVLVRKGVLNKQDAAEILQDVRAAAAAERQQERAEIIQSTKEAVREDIRKDPKLFADGLPAWIRRMQLKGDFRLRYEAADRDGQPDRNRGRYRLRLGVVTQLNDKVDVGFGIASGSSDPRSTNETMDNTFETGDLRLDYAYARYRPWQWVSLMGGKFPNPLFCPSDMLWDSDIRPEGASAVFTYEPAAAPWLELFMNTGFWVVDERSGDENDPTMYVVQPGSKIELGRSLYFKNALTYYQFDNVKNTTLDYSSGTNTLRKYRNTLKYDYDALAVSGELGWKTPFVPVPFVAVFAEGVKNTSTGSDDSGYAAGMRFGAAQITKLHDWQFLARYLRLERDAWVDALTDADNYDGQTNIKGYKAQLKYGLFENVYFVGSYFSHDYIKGDAPEEQKLQLDINFNF